MLPDIVAVTGKILDKIPLPLDMHFAFGNMSVRLRQVLYQHFPFHVISTLSIGCRSRGKRGAQSGSKCESAASPSSSRPCHL